MKKPNGYWTKQRVQEEAKKYSTRIEWRKASGASYKVSLQSTWHEESCAHMVNGRAIPTKWNKANVLADAKKYKTIGEWQKKSSSAYTAASRKQWMSEATAHMEVLGNHLKRCVYLIRIKGTRKIYIGITGNIKKRFADHLESARFIKLAKEHGDDSIKIEKITSYLNAELAAEIEKSLITFYKAKGFTVLNKDKGGGLGGGDRKWTEKALIESSKPFKTIKAWKEDNPSAYYAACNHKLLLKIAKGMERLWEKKWDKPAVLKDAKKYKSKSEWKSNSASAVSAARKNGWFEEASSHMKRPQAWQFKWSKQAVIEDAMKYKTITEWQKSSSSAYTAAWRNDWLPEATAHMGKRRKSK